jgi:hypothetical protein
MLLPTASLRRYSYAAMLRVYKHYDFALHDPSECSPIPPCVPCSAGRLLQIWQPQVVSDAVCVAFLTCF